MKKIIFLFFILIVLHCCLGKPKQVDKYVDSKIVLGISKDSLVKLYGKPDTIIDGNVRHTFSSKIKIYVYPNKFGSSDDINVAIDTNNIVIDCFSCN